MPEQPAPPLGAKTLRTTVFGPPLPAGRWRILTGGPVVLLLLAALPLVAAGYANYLIAEIAMYGIVALGLNILTGYSGQISIGQGALLGIGAYACAIIILRLGWPYPVGILAAGVVAGAIGILLGIPAVRLSGPYLAGSTLVLAVSLPELLVKYKDLSGGSSGLQLSQPSSAIPGLSQNQWYAYLAIFVCLVMCILAWNVLHGRVGRAWIAIRDNEVAASLMGINVGLYKVLGFGLSSFYAGIGGGVYAIIVGSVAPGSFGLLLSVLLLAMVVIGGLGSIAGSIIGAAFLTLLPLWSQGLASHAPRSIQLNIPWAIYGLLLIVTMIFFPTGLAGLPRASLFRRPGIKGKAASA